MRKFYLENEYGIRKDLNIAEGGMITAPSGLGYAMTANYINIGSSYLQSYINTNQADISGTLVFGGNNPYRAYREYADYINTSERLRLLYSPGEGEYSRDVDAISLDKGEMDKGVLQCKAVFRCKSLFYINKEDRFMIDRKEGELRFNFRWPIRFNDYNERSVTIENTGHVAAPFTAEIFGYTEIPVIEILVNNEVISRVVFDVILQENERILYSSLDGDLYCYKLYEDGSKENMAAGLDLMNDNFFKIPVGKSVVRFSSKTGVANKTILQIYQFYRTV